MSGRPAVSVAVLVILWAAIVVETASPHRTKSPQRVQGVKPDEAMGRLLKVFGLNHPGRRERHYAPPQYMLDLYNTIADSSGITHTVNPYFANIVRSFPDKDTSHGMHFYFNLTDELPEKENILEAEFHLYKLKPRTKTLERYPDPRTHLLEVRIYQVLIPTKPFTEEGNRLLDIRRISAHSVGWEVFYIKPAVLDWAKDDKLNYGLFISVKNMMGLTVEDGMLRFAKRHQHHVNKQPILVIFSDDGRPKHSTTANKQDFRDYGYPDLSFYHDTMVPPNEENSTKEISRIRRSEDIAKLATKTMSPKNPPQGGVGCTRHELYVDFEKIGWSSWIISPKGYNAYHCKGECSFPLGQNQWPTNHATVQSIVNELKLTPDVDTPCCVPNKLYSISLLYFDEHGNVILKQYDDMVASSCGCH